MNASEVDINKHYHSGDNRVERNPQLTPHHMNGYLKDQGTTALNFFSLIRHFCHGFSYLHSHMCIKRVGVRSQKSYTRKQENMTMQCVLRKCETLLNIQHFSSTTFSKHSNHPSILNFPRDCHEI